MKREGLQQILGRRIAAVVVASNARHPRQQVFLVFHDGTRFEFYGEHFTCAGGLDTARDLERYVDSAQGKITSVDVQPRASASGVKTASKPAKTAVDETDDGEPKATQAQKADAWRLAWKAIGKAKG